MSRFTSRTWKPHSERDAALASPSAHPRLTLVVRAVPLREFLDGQGVPWRVWATVPTHHHSVADDLRAGWLTFASGAERRRLAPIPRRWESMDDERLRLALGAAITVPRPRVSTETPSERLSTEEPPTPLEG